MTSHRVLCTILALTISGGFGLPAPALADESVAQTPVTSQDPPAVEPAAEESSTPGWFRLDTDGAGTQFWVGATHSVRGLNIASDIYVVGTSAEFDIGPAFTFGDLSLTPMVGVSFDIGATRVASLAAAQLYTILNLNKFYFESWVQLYVGSMFAESTEDYLHSREFLLYKLSDAVAVGPQIEIKYRLNEYAGDPDNDPFESGISNLPVGGAVRLGYGRDNTLLVFLGYETQHADGADPEDSIGGRFSFIRSW
jgi:hypothetical protein